MRVFFIAVKGNCFVSPFQTSALLSRAADTIGSTMCTLHVKNRLHDKIDAARFHYSGLEGGNFRYHLHVFHYSGAYLTHFDQEVFRSICPDIESFQKLPEFDAHSVHVRCSLAFSAQISKLNIDQ